jgi:hypothetical protein
MGIAQALLTLIGIKFFIAQYARQRLTANKISNVLLIMGTFPFLLALNRPEQPLLLLFLGSTYLSKKVLEIKSKIAIFFIKSAQILILVSMPALHPKGALFSIVALSISIYLAWRNSKFLMIPEVGLTLISIWESTKIWNLRTLCPESSFMTETFKIITLNPTKIDISTPQMVLGNLIRTPKYILHMLYQPNHQSNWLSQSNPIPILIAVIGNIAILLFCLFLVKSLLSNFVLRTIKLRQLDLSSFTAATLLSVCITLILLQRTKNFYDTYLVMILLGLAAAITYEPKLPNKFKSSSYATRIIALSVSPALCFTLINIAPEKQNDYELIGNKIVSECGITSKQIATGNFILDPSLTRYFWNSPRFIYSSYIWGWWAQDINVDEILDKIKPSVIIVRNENLLKPLSGDVIVGDFYCRNLSRLKR